MKKSIQPKLAALLAAAAFAMQPGTSRASIAYGSINNFDTVNDTGHECHGFEIELEDCHSTDITYTYDYNHYGTSKITEDNSVPGPSEVLSSAGRAKKTRTARGRPTPPIPAGPISPTNGHMFTNPSVNFGGEHFGVGYHVAVTAVRYNWLIDDGAGNLVHGGDGAGFDTRLSPIIHRSCANALPQVQAVIRRRRHPSAGTQGVRQGSLGEGNPHHLPQQPGGEASRSGVR